MRYPYTLFITLLVVALAQSQDANFDVVLMTDGDEKTGKVTEIMDDEIKFVHKGESLTYALQKSNILKITFGSGRIEFFNRGGDGAAASSGSAASAGTGGSLGSHHNKVAILPFGYLIDKQEAGEDITFRVQQEAYSFLQGHVGQLQLQSPQTTNALLIKAGVNSENIRGYTMGEICNMLDVEYVVQGMVTQDLSYSTQSTIQNNTYNRRQSNNRDDDRNRHHSIGSIKSSSTSSSVSTATDHYETSITMNIYTDRGDNIFSQDHQSLWDEDNAYKVTLRYLLKRTPIYRK